MVVGRLLKLATSILMASSVAVIVEFQGPIVGNMPTKPNAPTVAMCMEQTDLTCMSESALSVKKGPRGSGSGRLPKIEFTQTRSCGKNTGIHHGKTQTKTNRS